MARWLVDLLISERVVMAVILLNTAVMTAAGFFPDGHPERAWLDAVDYACVLFFVVEVILKVRRQGWRVYRASGWNRFDFLITVLCLPVLVEPWVHSAHALIWLPVFRAGRLFRLLRLLRFIPDAAGIALGVARALRASVGVFLALGLLNLIFALTATFLFGEVAPERFGDPARSAYSMFQIFTVEGWDEFPAEVEARVGEGTPWVLAIRAFFVVAVLVGGLMGFSLANAVFIDEMTLDNNRDLEAKVDALTAEIAELRRSLDTASKRD
ncbi:MAG: ion transporter [Acidobacteriota bacterium]